MTATAAAALAPLLAARHGGALLREKLGAVGRDPDLRLTSEGDAAVLLERVAGTAGTVRVHAAAGPGAAALLERALGEARAAGGRLGAAELPDDEPWTAFAALLRGAGFVEAGRVPDFHADGVAMVLLTRPLA